MSKPRGVILGRVVVGVSLVACAAGSRIAPSAPAPRKFPAGAAVAAEPSSIGPSSPATTEVGTEAPTAAPSASSGVAASPPTLPPPKPTTISLRTGDRDANDAELAAADEAFERGDLSEAQKHYESARAASPHSVAPVVGLARIRVARANVPLDYAAAKGNSEVAAAARDLAVAVKTDSSFGPGFVELGRALLLLGDATAAIDALVKGTRLLSDQPEAHSQLGVGLLATGHAMEAVPEFARAVQLDPGSAARHGNLGTALMMTGRTKEAVAEYETRVRLDDGDAKAHSDLGTALLGTDDLARGLSELQRAVQLDPQRPTFHSNLGFAFQQAGRRQKAIDEYREALRLDPKLVSAWINLATALALEPTTRSEARSALRKARALAPDDPRVKANLEELDALEKQAPAAASP